MALWYRDVPHAAILDSLQNVQWAPGLARGIALLQAAGFAIGIASITWRFAVEYFADQWGIEHCLATTLHDVGRIDHVWPEHKAEWLLELSKRLGIPGAHTAAVGDSAGDYDMLSVANTSIFVGTELPQRQQNWLHWPAADIEHIASHLLETMTL
jgi:phosphoserine phosphatase